MGARRYCLTCERAVVHLDAYGECRKCARASADDGSYTLEDAVRLAIVTPAVIQRLERELRALRKAALPPRR